MDKIRRIKVNDVWYCSIEDVVKVLTKTKDMKEAIKMIVPKKETVIEMNNDVDNNEPLSDFNQKLKKGLDFNPRDSK